ncbi:MspA family porin [Nocardia nepalensis]|uniref:MspA family porin n=1 Tax=Nocardia nepalensis TaxID=3375448 RepID=UPI003B67059C
MNRKHSQILAVIIAVTVAATGAVTAASAAPGEVNAGGLHVVASVDSNSSASPGGDIASNVPFAHQVKVSAEYSVHMDGVSSLRSGQIVAGYLIGCAVDISNGISVGIAPSVGVSAGIAPSITITSGMPPSVSVSVSPNVGVNAGITGALSVTVAPGNVTAVAIGTALLDPDAAFPYTFGHTNTPLNVSGCLSPASAMPFVTVTADATNSTAQTTGYGTEFAF